jgi:hypothetical protein
MIFDDYVFCKHIRYGRLRPNAVGHYRIGLARERTYARPVGSSIIKNFVNNDSQLVTRKLLEKDITKVPNLPGMEAMIVRGRCRCFDRP